MKTNKWLVAAVIAVILIGGAYGGRTYVENKVVGSVRDAFAKSESAKAGAIRFSLSDRKFVLSDVDMIVYKGTPFEYPAKAKSVEAVLPWEFLWAMLTSKLAGEKLIAETAEAKGVEYNLKQPEPMTMTFDTAKLKGLRADPALWQRVLLEKTPTYDDVAAFTKTASVDWAEVGQIKAMDSHKSIVQIGSVTMEKARGLRFDAMRVADTSVSVALEPGTEAKKLMSFAAFSMEKFDLPADVLRMIFDMAADANPSPEQTQALLAAMFSGKAPLFQGLSLRELKVEETVFPLSMRSWRFEWPSNEPMRHNSKAEGIIFPSALIAEESGFQFPNMQNLELSIVSEVESDAQGNVKEHDVYSVKNLFDFEINANVKLGASKLKGMPMTLWDTDGMLNAVITNIALRLEDKGLMAYLLLNAEGPEATGDGVLNMMPLRPGANKEAYTKMIDSIKTFVKQPGTLSVAYTPEKPVPFMQLLEIMGDPAAYLTISATPGTTSSQEQVKKLQAPAK